MSFGSAILPAATLLTPSAPQAGIWIRFVLVVNLRNLPKRYSCDDLEYKFRDVLLAIGARPESILAYRCEQSLGGGERSPEVHVRFTLADLARGPDRKSSDPSVTRKSIELQPGHPATLGAADCDLLRQIKGVLLTVIPVQVVSYRLACEAASRAEPPFKVSVSAWAPAGPPRLVAAPALPATAATVSGSRR